MLLKFEGAFEYQRAKPGLPPTAENVLLPESISEEGCPVPA
jgi:hypothetical protein